MTRIIDSGVGVQAEHNAPPWGFATVYRHAGEQSMGVWLTSVMEPQGAMHTNAVVTTREDQHMAEAMAYRRLVVLAGNDPVEMPRSITVERLRDLFDQACTASQEQIDTAIAAHIRRTRNRNLIRPEWRPAPHLPPRPATTCSTPPWPR